MKERFSLRIFLVLAAIEGLISLVWLVRIPGELQHAVLLGLSKTRLLLVSSVLLVVVFAAGLTVLSCTNPAWERKTSQRFNRGLQKRTISNVLIAFTAIGLFAGACLLALINTTSNQFLLGYLTRFAPLIFWLILFCGQSLIYVFSQRGQCANPLPKVFWVYILLVLGLSLAVFKLSTYSISHWEKLPDAVYGIITGRPHWRAYSNRLLGPYAVYLISLFGLDFDKALELFYFLLLSAQNVLLFILLARHWKTAYGEAFKYVVYFSFLFLLIQDSYTYPWDYIDALIFTGFAWGIFRQKSSGYFVLLFLVELLNRETALFVALYLILDSFQFERRPSGWLPHISRRTGSTGKLVLGGSLLLSGALYIKWVRDWLFIESSLARVGDDLGNQLFGNHNHLIDNIRDLFSKNFTSLDSVNSLFFFGLILYLLFLFPRFLDYHYKAFLTVGLLSVAILISGRVNETRMLTVLIPFFLMFHLDIGSRDSLGA